LNLDNPENWQPQMLTGLRADPPLFVAAAGSAATGDRDLNQEDVDWVDKGQSLRPAAVLVPIVCHADGPTMLLTQRTDHLNHHAGQISFPGGRAEAEDDGPIGTALRETEEEIGLGAEFIDIQGYLDAYETGTGFHITPVVGFVRPGFSLVPDDFEVAEVFEVPLAFLLDPDNHEQHSRTWNGRKRRYFAMPYHGYYIWGATAGIIMNLYRRVYGLNQPT
jgi:8-oxo-dGTP pyrophosphatase MutT (NUDIX family)